MDKTKNIKLFVYGSLMRGFFNHYYLNGAIFLREDATKPCCSLYNLGEYPGLLKEGKMAVKGEVYLIDNDILAYVDTLEEYPDVYIREEIELESSDFVITYFIKKDTPEFERSFEIFESWREYALKNNMK
jgi:gamma-glutamylcyclotransferase (GGCT)/AIG2-like uncharacterized protein YtfP